jgi:hypothetical protein
MMFVPHRIISYVPPRPVTGQLYFLYVGDVCTSQEIYLLTYTACYRNSFTF